MLSGSAAVATVSPYSWSSIGAHALSDLLVSGHARPSPEWWAIPPATIALYRLCGLRRARSAGGHRAGMSVPGQPGVAGGVLAGVVGVEAKSGMGALTWPEER